jgi:hypothetical protein
MEKERLAIGCNVDRPTYDWLQSVRSKLQKDSSAMYLCPEFS